MARQSSCRTVGHSVSSLPTFDNANHGDPGLPRTLPLLTSMVFYQKTICDIKELYRLIDARSPLEKLSFPKIAPQRRKNSKAAARAEPEAEAAAGENALRRASFRSEDTAPDSGRQGRWQKKKRNALPLLPF